MNISFLKDDPLNTVIVDSSDGRPLYEVDTPWKWSERTTTVRRVSPAGQGPIVARIRWRTWGSTKVVFMGNEMHIDDFLRKSGFMSDSRIITASDGREYKWKHPSGKFKLIECQTKTVIAESHRSKIGLFSQPRKMNIDLYSQGVHNIDVIVVSFIMMEEKQRETSRSTTQVAVVAAAIS